MSVEDVVSSATSRLCYKFGERLAAGFVQSSLQKRLVAEWKEQELFM